jgi:hypothetical protein
LFFFLNAACIDHPNPARRAKGLASPAFFPGLFSSRQDRCRLLGILMDEEANDWSEVLFEGLTLNATP